MGKYFGSSRKRNLSQKFFLIQKPLFIITNKVQGTRQAYIKNAKTLQKAKITECITECLSTNKTCLQKLSHIN